MSSLQIVDSETGEVLYTIPRERVQGMVERQTMILGLWKTMWKWLGRPEFEGRDQQMWSV